MTAYRAATYVALAILGGVLAWYAAPDIESILFPPLMDVYYLPFSPDRPNVMVERQLDRVCWRMHIRKARSVSSRLWALTLVLSDGTRYFTKPIDARTGQSFSTKDTYQGGFDGEVPLCAELPEDMNATQAFQIESFARYEPNHHLWTIEQTLPVINVPAVLR